MGDLCGLERHFWSSMRSQWATSYSPGRIRHAESFGGFTSARKVAPRASSEVSASPDIQQLGKREMRDERHTRHADDTALAERRGVLPPSIHLNKLMLCVFID